MAKILSLEVFKKRPVLTTSIVVVGGLLVYLLFFRGGSGSSGEQQGYGDSQVNTASGLQLAQSQSSARAQEIQGQLALAQIQGGNALNLAMAQANLQRDIAALSFESARLDHVRDMYGLEVQERIETLGITTSAQLESLRVSNELEALKAHEQAQLNMQQIITNGNVSLAQQAAQVSIAGINATTALAQIQSNAMIEQTKLTTGAQKSAAKSASSASKTSTWVGAAVAIASLFCDRYIKTIDGCVDEDACAKAIREMPVEMWRYLQGSVGDDGGKFHFNTYSQDFYRTLGAPDWSERKQIDVVDYLGALTGAFKALDRKVTQ